MKKVSKPIMSNFLNSSRTMRNALVVFFAITLFVSCSKDDDNEESSQGAIVRLEIENSFEGNFNENVVVELASVMSDTQSLNVSGTTWDDTINSPYAKVFMKNGLMANSYIYETNQEVYSFTYGVTIKENEPYTIPLITTLKFYVNNELVKTREIITEGESETFEVIDVSVY